MALLRGVWCVLRLLLVSRRQLVLENLALRHLLAVLRRSVRHPWLRPWARVFWVWPSRWWNGWKDALDIVTPATVVAWHRQGFRLYWRWKARGGPGRACIDPEVRRLIRRLNGENRFGARHGFVQNCGCWAMMQLSPPWPTIWPLPYLKSRIDIRDLQDLIVWPA